MPPGTLGVEAVGTVTAEDYSTVLVPALEAALERGDVRLMYVLGDDFDSYTAKAVWADARLGTSQWRSWQRLALISDADWLENAVKALGWMIPGDVKVFETDEVAEAKAWLVGIDLDDD